jgi:uncharacterized membrane protein YkvA (DUF1232 family)
MSSHVKAINPTCFQGISPSPQVEAEKPALQAHVATSNSEIASTQWLLDQNHAMPRSKLDAGTNKLLVCVVAFVHDIVFLYQLMRHPKTPWYARGLLCLPVMYLCSPVQLMPSFIPVLGQMDDVCVIWMAKKFARRLVDVKTRQECYDAAAAIKLPPLVKRLAGDYKSKGGQIEGR